MRYGDIVYFYFSKKIGEEEFEGFLGSLGIKDSRIFLDFYSDSKGSDKSKGCFINYQDYYFEIKPLLENKLRIEYEQIVKKNKSRKHVHQENSLQDRRNNEKDNNEIEEMVYKKLLEEQRENEAKILKYKGVSLKYGEFFLLSHLSSGKCLSVYKKEEYEIQSNSLYIKLRNKISRKSVFTFMQVFQSSQVGEVINYFDLFYIYNPIYDIYLNDSNTNMSLQTFSQPINGNLPYLNFSYESQFRKIVIGSSYDKCSFSVGRFKNIHDEENYIYDKEIVQIAFSDIKAIFKVNIDKNNEVIRKEVLGPNEKTEDQIDLFSLWIVNIQKDNKQGTGLKPSLVKTQSKESLLEMNNNLYSDNIVTLRNIVTGYYMSFEVNDQNDAYLILSRGTRNSRFKILSYDGSSLIQNNTFVRFSQTDTLNYFTASIIKSEKSNTGRVNNSRELSYKSIYIDSTSFKYQVEFKTYENNSNLIRISKVSLDLAIELDFCKHVFYFLQKLKEHLQCSSKFEINELTQTIKLFSLIERFVQNPDKEDYNVDSKSQSSKKNSRNQRLLKDFQILDILMDIYDIIKQRKFFGFAMQLSEDTDPLYALTRFYIFEFLRNIFDLIIIVIDGCFENQIYLSKWMAMVINDSFNLSFKDIEIGIDKLFVFFMNSNYVFFESFINDQSLRIILQNFLETKNYRILEIFYFILKETKKHSYVSFIRNILLNDDCFESFGFILHQKGHTIFVLNNFYKIDSTLDEFEEQIASERILEILAAMKYYYLFLTQLFKNDPQSIVIGTIFKKVEVGLIFNLFHRLTNVMVKEIVLVIIELFFNYRKDNTSKMVFMVWSEETASIQEKFIQLNIPRIREYKKMYKEIIEYMENEIENTKDMYRQTEFYIKLFEMTVFICRNILFVFEVNVDLLFRIFFSFVTSFLNHLNETVTAERVSRKENDHEHYEVFHDFGKVQKYLSSMIRLVKDMFKLSFNYRISKIIIETKRIVRRSIKQSSLNEKESYDYQLEFQKNLRRSSSARRFSNQRVEAGIYEILEELESKGVVSRMNEREARSLGVLFEMIRKSVFSPIHQDIFEIIKLINQESTYLRKFTSEIIYIDHEFDIDV